jgi:DNA-binding NtrC family response regulator
MDTPMAFTQGQIDVGTNEPFQDFRELLGPVVATKRGNLVLLVEDQPDLAAHVGPICDYVGLDVEVLSSSADLGLALDDRRPTAVVASFEMLHQDGGHILKAVAVHDRNLPVMLLTGRNVMYQGAAEALVEVLNLTAVTLPVDQPTFGECVEFLARAAQGNRRRRASQISGLDGA